MQCIWGIKFTVKISYILNEIAENFIWGFISDNPMLNQFQRLHRMLRFL